MEMPAEITRLLERLQEARRAYNKASNEEDVAKEARIAAQNEGRLIQEELAKQLRKDLPEVVAAVKGIDAV